MQYPKSIISSCQYTWLAEWRKHATSSVTGQTAKCKSATEVVNPVKTLQFFSRQGSYHTGKLGNLQHVKNLPHMKQDQLKYSPSIKGRTLTAAKKQWLGYIRTRAGFHFHY